MKLPISWLREWVEYEATPAQVADSLTRRGLYVEGLQTQGASLPGVVVARVIEVRRHPNADRLTVCRVDGGGGELTVVCGAPNVRAGMVVPLATVGARLPGGAVIRPSTIRGAESQGMLCSARELELADDHEGIVDLERLLDGAAGLVAGRPLEEVLGPPDTVLEIEIPFNRPDGLGVVGLAREARAALDGRWTPAARARLEARWSGPDDFDLELEDREGCPRYIAQAVEGLTVGPSPPWLRRRLESVGQRPINNVVDATNLVLFEFGQPVHAFDLDRLEGPAIRVRRAGPGERIVTLDGRERALDPEVLVIADRARPVAVAGVMGGADTEVSGRTTRLLLEVAWFDPVRIRRGARALGLATEASRRFERGVDPEVARAAAARFLSVLTENAPGARLGSARAREHRVARRRTVPLRASRCERLIGVPLPADQAARLLASLDFEVAGGDPLAVTVPTWRVDVTLEDDLVEEVARAYGYDRIPEVPLATGGQRAVRSGHERLEARARAAMLARGLDEAWTTTLLSEREAADAARLLGEDPARLLRLSNPMSQEGALLRPNPVGGLLRACAHNLRQGAAAVRLFEIGAGFLGRGQELPEEIPMLAALVAGGRYAHGHDTARQEVDFADARGLWEAWLAEMRVDTPEWRPYAAPGWKPGASAEVAALTSRIAWAGTLGHTLLRAWGIEAPVHLFVARLDRLAAAATRPALVLPGRFPPVRRDLAFFVPEAVSHRQLERALSEAAGDRLGSIELFDVYTGPGTPPGMKGLAYALRFQHPDRTMTEAEVQAIQDRMVAAVASACGGRLREK